LTLKDERVFDLKRRRWVDARSFLLSLALLLALASPAAAKVQLTYYHRSNITEAEWAKAVIERFNAAHPHIEVISLPSGTGGGPEYAEKLAVLRASGTAPDIFFGSTDKLGYILKGWALDLTPFIERDRAELQMESFFPGVWDSFTREGRIYGVPLTVTPQLLFYNKDMFQSAGLPFLPLSWDDPEWTWDQLVEYSKKLTRFDASGAAERLALAQATESHLPDVVWMFGGDWFDEDAYRTGRARRATFTRPENVEAYTALVEYYAQYAAAGPPKGISAGSGFANGLIAMDWIGAWKTNSYIEASRSGGMGFDWGIGPVPLVKNRANTRWTDPLYISSTTEYPEEAWTFVKFAANAQSQALWSQMTAKIPARSVSVDAFVQSLSSVSGMSEEEVLISVSEALAHSRTSLEESIADVQLEIVGLRGEYIEPMLAGNRPVLSTLQALEEVINAKLAELSRANR